ncbi:uncharacterized protein LOC122301808 [Carya illinoinensis]|uniref:uncharacterized protein LOC122301808 n=1 Tax=Carya illinoinensis TaxID=32201 RepID=UPI001C727C63|nr:uncharacterized protein LOC122301808 [Carya illinoinensis]
MFGTRAAKRSRRWRNDVLHGKNFLHPTSVFQKAVEEARAYEESVTPSGEASGRVPVDVQRWKKPESNWFKHNWDAVVRDKEGRIGIGAVVRDSQGLVIGTLRAQRSLKGCSSDAEAYGLLVAAVFCRELGLQQVCFEGDSKHVVNLLLSKEVDWSMGGCLVEDARKILNSSIRWTASHVKREANKAAHQLAKSALEESEDVYDIEVCPQCIKSIVASELL